MKRRGHWWGYGIEQRGKVVPRAALHHQRGGHTFGGELAVGVGHQPQHSGLVRGARGICTVVVVSQRALRRRLRERGVRVVTLPAGHYILAAHRPAVEAVVAEINANLRRLCAGREPAAGGQLRVFYRPIPAPTDGEAA